MWHKGTIAAALAVLTGLLGCGASPADSDSAEANLDRAACGAMSPQFDKIRQLVEPLNGAGGSYTLSHWNKLDPQPLLRGPEVFGAMADLIELADEDVTFQTWRWDNDGEPARLVLAGMKRLNERLRLTGRDKPVVVQLLINALAVSPADQMAILAKHIEDLNLDPKLVDVRLTEFVAVILGANHAKTLVVDAKKAILTGMNASGDNAGAGPLYWDAGYRVEGEVARGLHNDFATAWADGERWTCGSHPEVITANTEKGGTLKPSKCRSKPEGIPLIDVKLPAEARAGLSCIPVMMVGHKERSAPFPSDKTDNPQDQAFIGMFAFAQKRIRIQSPNLNDDTARNAIIAAIRSGIEVDLILSYKYEEMTESMPGRGGTNEHTVEWLHSIAYDIPDAKRCKLLQIRWFSNDGKAIVDDNGPPSSHVKYMSIDGQIAMVGSANQDVQSWQNSREINLVIDSPALTQSYDEKIYDAAWSKAITVDRCAAFE